LEYFRKFCGILESMSFQQQQQQAQPPPLLSYEQLKQQAALQFSNYPPSNEYSENSIFGLAQTTSSGSSSGVWTMQQIQQLQQLHANNDGGASTTNKQQQVQQNWQQDLQQQQPTSVPSIDIRDATTWQPQPLPSSPVEPLDWTSFAASAAAAAYGSNGATSVRASKRKGVHEEDSDMNGTMMMSVVRSSAETTVSTNSERVLIVQK
jgi:hypothetical protein